jgi:hypothetical protein
VNTKVVVVIGRGGVVVIVVVVGMHLVLTAQYAKLLEAFVSSLLNNRHFRFSVLCANPTQAGPTFVHCLPHRLGVVTSVSMI